MPPTRRFRTLGRGRLLGLIHRADVRGAGLDRETVVVGQTSGDEGAVAGLGVALDAEERGEAFGGQRRDEGREVDAVEDLGRVATDVLGRELDARALADAEAGVLGVLELAQLGRRSELGVVAIAERRGGEGVLEAPGVGPRVLRSANAAALADVQDEADVGRRKALEERVAGNP